MRQQMALGNFIFGLSTGFAYDRLERGVFPFGEIGFDLAALDRLRRR